MERIFYDEAANILGVSVDTLAQAISRGELTRAGIQGNRRLLIKEQVMLFTGLNLRTGNKKRISYNGLSVQEQALWKRYADEAQRAPVGTPAPVVDEDALSRIIEQRTSKIEESIKEDIFDKLGDLFKELSRPKVKAIA